MDRKINERCVKELADMVYRLAAEELEKMKMHLRTEDAFHGKPAMKIAPENPSMEDLTKPYAEGFYYIEDTNSRIRKQHRYDCAYMKMAQAFSELSHAVRCKVGCIIVSPNGQIVSQGYNGMPSGFPNCCEHKDEDGNLVTNIEVLHAESNAITKCAKWGSSTEGCTLYVTMSPCVDCAKLIIQSGILRVIYGEKYRNTEGLELLERAGISVEQLNE